MLQIHIQNLSPYILLQTHFSSCFAINPCLKSGSYLTFLHLPRLPHQICESGLLTSRGLSFLSTPTVPLDAGPPPFHLSGINTVWKGQPILSGKVSLLPGHALTIMPTIDKMNLSKKKNQTLSSRR